MDIKKHSLTWAFPLSKRNLTTHLILHHADASRVTVETIHNYHISRGWSGIAYHFLVGKDGVIHEGRPIDTIGGHTSGMNYCSIGVCFEGNFEVEQMPDAQLLAGQELIKYITEKYPNLIIGQHKEFNATACAGKYFPFDEICNGADPEPATGNVEIIPAWKKSFFDFAKQEGLITSDEWLNKLDEPAPVWLVFAIAERIKKP